MAEGIYHLDSLAFAVMVCGAATLACLALMLRRFADELRASLRAWLTGAAILVAVDLILFLGIHPVIDRALTGAAAIGVAEWIHALRIYAGSTRRLVWPYVIALGGAALALAVPSYPGTVLASSLSLGVLHLGAAWAAARIREPERSMGRLLLVAVFATFALVLFVRLGLFLSGFRSGAPEGFTSAARALLFVLVSLGPVVGSYAFVLACGERLGDRIRGQGLTDSLSGLANRRALFDALDRALAGGKRHHEPVAVLLVDLDEFKRVNDAAGHAAGDAALVEVARRMRSVARADDVLGRLGGEEFGAVLPGVDAQGAETAAERMRLAVADTPVRAEGRTFALTVSIGVVEARAGEDSTALLARAEALLYEAKRRGRNRVLTESGTSV